MSIYRFINRFSCQFEIKNNGEGFLYILESNQFRVLTHMSLRFREATDQILKQYLSHRLSMEKSSNEDFRMKVENLEQNLNHRTNELDKTTRELKKVQDDINKKIQEILLQEQQKLHEDKQSSFEKETKIIRENEDEKKQLMFKYDKSTRELQSRADTLSLNVQELQEIRLILESKERELNNRLRLLEKENSIQQKEVESLRNDNKVLEKTRFEQEKQIAELSARCSNLEQQARSKEELNEKTKELIESANAQKVLKSFISFVLIRSDGRQY